jgi:chromosomal replication initiator protein
VFVNVNQNIAERPALPLWEQCLSAFLCLRPGELQWLSNIKHISAENGILSIEVPSELAKTFFIDQFYEAFLEIAKSIDACIEQISVIAPAQQSKVIVAAPELKKPERFKRSNFCSKYKLNNFVAGTSNELVLEAAKMIAAAPREPDNFFIIKGAAGLGKTHLLYAIGSEASAAWAKKAVLWDSDRFFKENRNDNLTMLYQADILLFDNLQNIFISESAQNELLNILKSLKNKERTVVVSINPKSKNNPTPEFANFLKMGIKCELKSPDLQTRMAILRQKAQEKGLPVAVLENCWKLIAEKFGESVCSLEGAINELVARQALLKCEITPMAVHSIYEEKNTKGNVPSIESIATAAARAYSIPVESLCGKSRIARVNKPRQIAIYLCKQSGFSLNEIGSFFNRDVSSVANAIQVAKGKIAGEDGYSFEFEVKDILNMASP